MNTPRSRTRACCCCRCCYCCHCQPVVVVVVVNPSLHPPRVQGKQAKSRKKKHGELSWERIENSSDTRTKEGVGCGRKTGEMGGLRGGKAGCERLGGACWSTNADHWALSRHASYLATVTTQPQAIDNDYGNECMYCSVCRYVCMCLCG